MKVNGKEVKRSLAEHVGNLEKDYRDLQKAYNELAFQNTLSEIERKSLREINERVENENAKLRKENDDLLIESVTGKDARDPLYIEDEDDYDCEDEEEDVEVVEIDLDEIIAVAEKLTGQKVIGVVPLAVEDEAVAVLLSEIFNAVVVAIG